MIVLPLLPLFILECWRFDKDTVVSISRPVFVILFPSLHFFGLPLVFCVSPLAPLIIALPSLSALSQTSLPSTCFEKVLLLLNKSFSTAVNSPGFQHLVNTLLNVSEHAMQGLVLPMLKCLSNQEPGATLGSRGDNRE